MEHRPGDILYVPPQQATKPDPRLVPFDQELDAMRNCAMSFDDLTEQQRIRVLVWLRQRYSLDMYR